MEDLESPMKKYVFYKGLNECGFSVCQERIDWKTSFILKVFFGAM